MRDRRGWEKGVTKSFQTVPTGRAGASEHGDALAGAKRGIQGMTQVGHSCLPLLASWQEQSGEGRSLIHFLLPAGIVEMPLPPGPVSINRPSACSALSTSTAKAFNASKMEQFQP